MAAAMSESQFLCSICLEVFSEPVSTPCGHNFCKSCIIQSWEMKEVCECPLCKKSYDKMPELHINTFIQELVLEFGEKQESPSVENLSNQSSVPCDYCTEPKLKAVMSCLVCVSSYCEAHLQPHLTVPRLKSHQLMEPVDNLDDRLCPLHLKPLELFCQSEDSYLCTMCALLEHKNHQFVSLKEECDGKRSFLQQIQMESQRMVKQRRMKIQEIQLCFKQSQQVAKTEMNTGKKAFTSLMLSVRKRRDKFLDKLERKQRQIQNQTEDLVQLLETEICELEQRSTKAEKLQQTGDYLHFLRQYPALMSPNDMKEWSDMTFELDTCEGSVVKALAELEQSLPAEFELMPSKFELYKVQQFAVDVTLDPDTAHPLLALSEDLKQVHCGNVRNKLPTTPQRFTKSLSVLGKQSISSGSFCFEVKVEGKTDWTLGVAQESINRKRRTNLSPENGFWVIWLRNGNEYESCEDTWIPLSLEHPPQTVGVFVNYDEGLVCFYDAESHNVIFSFTAYHFQEKLLPYFDPCLHAGGKNTAPLIITAVE